MDLIRLLTNPPTLYSRSMVFSLPCPIPTERGIYGWFFKAIPGVTPIDRCVTKLAVSHFCMSVSHQLACKVVSTFASVSSITIGVMLRARPSVALWECF